MILRPLEVPAPLPSQGPSMRCASLTGLGRALARRGANLQGLCRAVGVDARLLANPHHRLPVNHYIAVLEAAARATGDDALGLRLGSSAGATQSDPLTRAVLRGGTLAAAFDRAADYLTANDEGARLELIPDGRQVLVRYSLCEPLPPHYRQEAELSIAKLIKFARLATNRPGLRPQAVYFRHDLGNHRRSQTLFGAPLHYSQTGNAVLIDRALLTLRIPDCRSEPLPVAAATLLDTVRRLLQEALETGDVGIDPVAASMGLSVRALQRRLGEQGTSFQAEIDHARFGLARQLLRQPALSLTEIALQLGYAELSVFSRAFRRWSGLSPIRFRSQTG